MCDLTEFFVSTITTETHAKNIAKLFMENIVLSFDMVVLLAVDTNIRFKSVFKDMCASLGTIYWPLVCENHKGTSVEKYHRFLNKTQTTAIQDIGINDIFLQNAKTSQYA